MTKNEQIEREIRYEYSSDWGYRVEGAALALPVAASIAWVFDASAVFGVGGVLLIAVAIAQYIGVLP